MPSRNSSKIFFVIVFLFKLDIWHSPVQSMDTVSLLPCYTVTPNDASPSSFPLLRYLPTSNEHCLLFRFKYMAYLGSTKRNNNNKQWYLMDQNTLDFDVVLYIRFFSHHVWYTVWLYAKHSMWWITHNVRLHNTFNTYQLTHSMLRGYQS